MEYDMEIFLVTRRNKPESKIRVNAEERLRETGVRTSTLRYGRACYVSSARNDSSENLKVPKKENIQVLDTRVFPGSRHESSKHSAQRMTRSLISAPLYHSIGIWSVSDPILVH